MNIFLLDTDLESSVKSLCDQHVVKMTLETAQILSTAAFSLKLPRTSWQYQPTHINHPCCIWAGESIVNFNWLSNYGQAISQEFSYRFNKIHGSQLTLDNLHRLVTKTNQPESFALAIKPAHRTAIYKPRLPLDLAVIEYRNYYLRDKIDFARWSNNRLPPWWWPT